MLVVCPRGELLVAQHLNVDELPDNGQAGDSSTRCRGRAGVGDAAAERPLPTRARPAGAPRQRVASDLPEGHGEGTRTVVVGETGVAYAWEPPAAEARVPGEATGATFFVGV